MVRPPVLDCPRPDYQLVTCGATYSGREASDEWTGSGDECGVPSLNKKVAAFARGARYREHGAERRAGNF